MALLLFCLFIIVLLFLVSVTEVVVPTQYHTSDSVNVIAQNLDYYQVLAFQKAGGRLALSLYVLLHNASAGLGGRLGARAPTPHEEAAVSVLKIFSRIYMYGNGLVVFGVFWGGLGYFEAVGFQHYMYGDGLVVFGVFWGGLGCFG